MNKKIHIINTGGTFNKVYNPINGEFDIPLNNDTIKSILKKCFKNNMIPKVTGIIFKDSLDMTQQDRELLLKTIKTLKEKYIIVIHGTDTMNITSTFLNKHIKNKTIIVVGSMVPYSIDPVEATGNLMMALGFLETKPKQNIYISMNGVIDRFTKIRKNYKQGYFYASEL